MKDFRDVTASLLKKNFNDVQTEPPLQPVTGERLPRSANREDGPDLTSGHGVFGMVPRRTLSLMSEFSIHLLFCIRVRHCRRFTDNMKRGRKVTMGAVYNRLNVVVSYR